jgi:hypothetical protein
MKYANEMGSGVIHTKFHKDWFSYSTVDGEGVHRQNGDRISPL